MNKQIQQRHFAIPKAVGKATKLDETEDGEWEETIRETYCDTFGFIGKIITRVTTTSRGFEQDDISTVERVLVLTEKMNIFGNIPEIDTKDPPLAHLDSKIYAGWSKKEDSYVKRVVTSYGRYEATMTVSILPREQKEAPI